MPLVRIEILKGHTPAYKKAFLDAVHDGLASALGVPDWDRFQRLYELDPDCFERSEDKTENFCIIEITIFPGRSAQIKGRIIQDVTRMLGERLGIAAADVFIVLHDMPAENWGLGGVQRAE